MKTRALLVVVIAATACLPRIPKQRLPEPTKIAVGYVVDPGYSGTPFAPPDELKQAINQQFDDHNLQPVVVPLETFAAQRLTDARFEALKKTGAAAEAKYLLLVEQRVHFFSQIDGRYRWEVGTALTAARADGPVAKDPFEIPVILMFDHEKEKEAITYAASDVANRVGVLMDGVIAGAQTAP